MISTPDQQCICWTRYLIGGPRLDPRAGLFVACDAANCGENYLYFGKQVASGFHFFPVVALLTNTFSNVLI